MVNESLLAGIVAHNIATARIRLNVLVHGADNGVPVIFIHGNTASSRFWEETMCALPPTYRAFAPDMRGYGITERLPVDGSRGLRDWSDDLRALVTTLSLGAVHLVGWSLGGGIGLQYAIDFPDEVRSLTLVDPIPPYGFGGTHGLDGQPNAPDYAGSGGGIVNVEFIKRMAAGDRGGTEPLSPRVVMNTSFFKPPFRVAPEREEIYLSALLETGTGDDFYPGDLTLSPNWPSVAPGTRGFANAFSPKYCNLSGFARITPKPPVLWVRGADDQIVSDTSFFDLCFLGQLGMIPGWPGAETHPAQPMVSQMRAMLAAYAAAGGRYTEHVLPDCGHSPHIEQPAEFQALLQAHLAAT